MMHMVFDQLGRDRPYLVEKMTGNLDRLSMESIAADEGAPKIFGMLADRSYKQMKQQCLWVPHEFQRYGP